jgi:zinc D-Ala-D-Ala carboxypeptidase
MQLTENFTDDEFKCPCCGQFIDSLPFRAFLAKLQDARNIAGTPFVITSGYRCPKHNAEVGGKADSSHLKGIAVDIRTHISPDRFAIINGLIKAGFERVGIGSNFIHVDMDTVKPQRLMWIYGP